MDKTSFNKLLIDIIQPILTGSEFDESADPNAFKNDVVTIQQGGQRLTIRPTKSSPYSFVLTRPQPFTAEDKAITKAIIEELEMILGKINSSYDDTLILYGTELAICKYLQPVYYNTLFQIINAFHKWSLRTYEGRKVSFSIQVDFNDRTTISKSNPSLFEAFEEDFFALLSNSYDSTVSVSADGAIIEHLDVGAINDPLVECPGSFEQFASISTDGKITLVLTAIGEVLIFRNKELILSKRRGYWNYFNHKQIIQRISGGSRRTNDIARKSVYESILDVSFARLGGCMAFVRTTDVNKIKTKGIVKDRDIISEENSLKSKVLSSIIANHKFQELPRTLRKELLGMDGATIIDYNGNIIAAGAIVKISAGSTGGGRTAAAKTLSKYGSAIKISSDGMVTGYSHRSRSNDEPKTIFKFG